MLRLTVLAVAIFLMESLAAFAEGVVPDRLPEGISMPALRAPGPEISYGTPSDNRRVVGILITRTDGKEAICSGLWISAHRILTAAHCTCYATAFQVTNGPFSEEVWLKASLHSIFGAFDCNRQPLGDDLALLNVAGKLPINKFGQRACETYSLLGTIRLGARWYPTPPRAITVYGYGFDGDEEHIGTQMSAEVAVNSFLCTEQLAQRFQCYPFGELIAGANQTDGRPKDSCKGDSGGPAVVDGVPVAIVSRGLPLRQLYSRGDCGSGGVYTHLGRWDVLQWLKQNGVSEGNATCPS